MTDLDLCAACGQRPPGHDWTLCHGCVDELDDALVGIPAWFARLDPRPGRSGGGTRGAPGFRSTSPARDDVLILTDPRTRMSADTGWRPATVNVLSGWHPSADRGSVAERCHALRQCLDHLAIQDWADECHQAITGHLRQLRTANSDTEPTVAVGPCPVGLVPDGGQLDDARPCGARVTAQAYGQTASCTHGHVWSGPRAWRQLGEALGPVELDAAELARYFGHDTTSTVRTWASRDDWPRRRKGGRTLFRLDAALATWARVNSPAPDSLATTDQVGEGGCSATTS